MHLSLDRMNDSYKMALFLSVFLLENGFWNAKYPNIPWEYDVILQVRASRTLGKPKDWEAHACSLWHLVMHRR
jgi:hypothetical protein